MSKDKNSDEIDLNKYKDLDGLSLKKMNFGLWLSEHRSRIMKSIIIFLIAISAISFAYSTYNYIVYYITSSSAEEEAAAARTNLVSQRNIVTDLLIGVPIAFKSSEAYDLVAAIKNPNDKFSATFQYCFLNNETVISCTNGFILPSEEKYIFSLGQKVEAYSGNVKVELRDISWKRFDVRLIPDWKSFSSSHINFNFEGINLALANESGLSEKIGLDSLEFSVSNRSPYSYYQVPLNITFYNGTELIGVNRYIVENFLAGETRQVRLSWLGGLSSAARTEIRPELNLLDDSIYLKYQGSN